MLTDLRPLRSRTGQFVGTLPDFDSMDDSTDQPDRFGYARDAAIQSFRNRLGRDPSAIELQQLIDRFRFLGLSDNLINAIAGHMWRPAMMKLAERECGHLPLPAPEPFIGPGM